MWSLRLFGPAPGPLSQIPWPQCSRLIAGSGSRIGTGSRSATGVRCSDGCGVIPRAATRPGGVVGTGIRSAPVIKDHAPWVRPEPRGRGRGVRQRLPVSGWGWWFWCSVARRHPTRPASVRLDRPTPGPGQNEPCRVAHLLITEQHVRARWLGIVLCG